MVKPLCCPSGQNGCAVCDPDIRSGKTSPHQVNAVGLGDTVALGWKDGFDHGTVSHVHLDGTIDVFRPYVHHSECSYAGREGSSRVICYVGIEESKHINPERVTVLRKAGPIR